MIRFHADDFGLFPEQSNNIINCCSNGILNGVSIFPNSKDLDICMDIIKSRDINCGITIHLNLVEGKSLSPAASIPYLVDKKGNLSCSFISLLIASYIPFLRRKYMHQIKQELRAQINRCKKYTGSAIELDSHCHFHMIPVVFDSIIEIINEDSLDISYIRVPKETISIYARCARQLSGFNLLSFIKVFVLNLLSLRNCRVHRKYIGNFNRYLFFGVMLSGNMNFRNAYVLLEHTLKTYGSADIEMLFHPGLVSDPSDIDRLTNHNDIVFMTDIARAAEADALCKLKNFPFDSLCNKHPHSESAKSKVTLT